jgi:uncharacterized membrane protein
MVLSGLVAIGLIVIRATLPWATVKTTAPPLTTNFRGGALSVGLTAVAILIVAMSLLQIIRPIRIVAWISLGGGVVGLILAIGLALSKIASANQFPVSGFRQTSYSVGALLGIVAGILLVVTNALGVNCWNRGGGSNVAP